MARELNRLNVKQIKAELKPGKYNDGGGLMLVVHPSGSKNWVVRTTVRRKRQDIGVGALPHVSLADARKSRDEIVRRARAGGDPKNERRRDENIPTFAAAAQTVFEERKATWRNKKHTQQWINTLKTYCYPFIGDESVEHIDQAAVRRCLEPIWTEKHETATRVLQRCEVIFNWAYSKGFRSAANPCTGLKETLPRARKQPTHRKAMNWRDLPAFYEEISKLESTSSLALQMVILTASRTNEVRFANWSEFQSDAWIIPGSRMKMGKEHRIPLTNEMKGVLSKARGRSRDLVFPGQRAGSPLSDMTLLKLLRLRTKSNETVHGFRSTFRDWVDEHYKGDGDVAEACLAHSKGSSVKKAYARSDLFERRRVMINAWNKFVTENRQANSSV